MISFVITSYNRPNELRACVDSILSLALHRPFEVVIADDGSSLENIGIIQNIANVKLILWPKNTGLAANINRGIRDAKGEFIVYLQDDWLVSSGFPQYVDEFCEVLRNQEADMIRLTSNVRFKKTYPVSENVRLIPRFSIYNIPNYRYRYSDHPFMVKSDFFQKFGFYQERTSTVYGETEYSIRMMKLNPKIGIAKNFVCKENRTQVSVRDENTLNAKGLYTSSAKKLIQKLGWLRYEYEALRYNPEKRGLITYKNYRQ